MELPEGPARLAHLHHVARVITRERALADATTSTADGAEIPANGCFHPNNLSRL
jgi:hypothetical protein